MFDAGPPPKLWLPPKPAIIRSAGEMNRHERRLLSRLIRPELAAFHVTQLNGFNVGNNPVFAIDDGGSGLAGGGTANHSVTITSTGPFTVVGFTWFDATSLRTISSVTWNGSAVTNHVSQGVDVIGNRMGCAILSIGGGPRSGSFAVTFSGNVDVSIMSIVSLVNVRSQTPIDTDNETAGAGGADLDSLTTPGAGGVRVFAYVNAANGTAITWATAGSGTIVEVADTDASVYRHGVAYELGDDGGAVAANAASSDEGIVGASWR